MEQTVTESHDLVVDVLRTHHLRRHCRHLFVYAVLSAPRCTLGIDALEALAQPKDRAALNGAAAQQLGMADFYSRAIQINRQILAFLSHAQQQRLNLAIR